MEQHPAPSIQHLDEVAARCREVFAQAPAGLLSDIDGTLSAIAPTPTEAFVDRAIAESLRALAKRLALVGAVSGRAVADGSAMVGVPELLYVGNHGLERLRGGVWSAHPAAIDAEQRVEAALAEVGAALIGDPISAFVLLEPKRLTGTVHYRLAPDHAAARARLRPLIAAACERHDLRLTEGRAILELRPPVSVNKGTAVAELVEEFGLRGVVFVGDDITDVDAFRAVKRLRAEHGVAGLAVGVLGPETPPVVREELDVAVDGVPAVAALLAALAVGSSLGSAPA
jgi:trehalose 6-phosphate phosphatase